MQSAREVQSEMREVLELDYFLNKAAAERGEKLVKWAHQAANWHYRTVPRHDWRSPGPDGVAFKDGVLRIVDNKNSKHGRRVRPDRNGGAGGLSALSLRRYLPQVLASFPKNPRSPEHKAFRDAVRRTAAAARLAVIKTLQGTKGLPPNERALALKRAVIDPKYLEKVELVVTNAGGRSKGVNQALTDLGVDFVDVSDPELAAY